MSLLKCSVFIASSLDGYIARPDGRIDWLTGAAEKGEDYGYHAFFRSVDCLVIGRKTYETALSFGRWPYEGKKVVVMTTNPGPVPDKLAPTVKMILSSPAEIAGSLRAQGCNHAYIDGGRTIQTFLAAGSISEMTITTIPILLGDGIRLFGKVDADIALRHIETKTYANGIVQTRYAPSRAASSRG